MVPSTLEELCRREHPRLVGALGLYCAHRGEAEDLAQEALVRLCQRWPLDGIDNPGGWLMRVAFNLATSQNPSTTRIPPMFAVRRAVRALPARQRLVLVLRYYADLSVREVADHLSCPEGPVKTLTRQAITGLRTAGLEVDADD